MRFPKNRNIFFKISCMNDSDKQAKLYFQIMNHHKFLMICMIKYHLRFWCFIIYKPSYQATVYKILFFLTFFITNSAYIQFFRREFMNHYKLYNLKFMKKIFWSLLLTKKVETYIILYYSTQLLDKNDYK